MQSPSLAGLRSPSRLTTLHATGLLDTPREAPFDRLTELASRSLEAPIAIAGLLDGEREFFKSCVGVPEPWASERQIPAAHSFCQHLLEAQAPLVIADARRFAAVAGTPAVSGLGMVAYAGVAIRCGGEVLGGFCVADREPREWAEDELDLVGRIGDAIAREIEVRLALRRSGRDAVAPGAGGSGLRRAVLDHSPAGSFLVQDGRFRYANPSLAGMFGWPFDAFVNGARALSLVSRPERRRVVSALRRWRREGGEPVRLLFRGARRDGSGVDVEVHGREAEFGGRPALVGTVLDRSRERAEEARRRSLEHRFRTLVENARDVVYLVEGDGTVSYVSPSVERLLGHPPRALVGRKMTQVVHPDARDAVERALRAAWEQAGETATARVRLLHRDRSQRMAEVRVQPVPGEDGAPMAIVNVHDVTAAVEAERQLRESEERYRLVTQATTDAVLEWAIRSGALSWNGAGARMLRYSPEEAGTSIEWLYERIHPEDRERVVREQEGVLAGTESHWTGEYRLMRGDGRYACVLHRGYVVRDARGHPVRMIGSLMDVTERKQSEEAQRFLARASALLDSSLDYEATLGALARLAVPTLADYCLIDLKEEDGYVRRVGAAHADPAREGILRTREVVSLDADPERHPVVKVNRTGAPVLVPDCSTEVLDRISHNPEHRARLEAVGLRSFMIVPLLAHDRILGSITLAASDSGRRYQLVDLIVAEDLARRAATAIEHASLYGELEQAVRDRDDVLGFVTHDLRNPLNTVCVAASFLLETEDERRSGNRKWLETIKRASDQMNRLIDDLFQVTRQGAGKFSLEPAQHPVPEVLVAARELLDPLASVNAVTFTCACDDALPVPWMDFDQVLRVLSNLVGNAIKFTPSGGVVALRAELDADEHAVRFSVTDTGPGIPDAELRHVFERYWQGRSGDRRGAGMGLAIAQGIVEAHGGRIWAENRDGGGAAFRFTLPVEPPAAARGGDVPPPG